MEDFLFVSHKSSLCLANSVSMQPRHLFNVNFIFLHLIAPQLALKRKSCVNRKYKVWVCQDPGLAAAPLRVRADDGGAGEL